jgi:hypothetical protein
VAAFLRLSHEVVFALALQPTLTGLTALGHNRFRFAVNGCWQFASCCR